MNNRLSVLFDVMITKYHRGIPLPRHAIQMIVHYASNIICKCGMDKFICAWCDEQHDKCIACYKLDLDSSPRKFDCVECETKICSKCRVYKMIYGEYYTFCETCSLASHSTCSICQKVYLRGETVTDLCSVHNVFACDECTNLHFGEFRRYGPMHVIKYRCLCPEVSKAYNFKNL